MRTGQNCGTIVLQNGSFLVLSLGLIVLTHTDMNLPKRAPKVHFFDLVLNQGFWEHLSCAGDSSTIIVG